MLDDFKRQGWKFATTFSPASRTDYSNNNNNIPCKLWAPTYRFNENVTKIVGRIHSKKDLLYIKFLTSVPFIYAPPIASSQSWKCGTLSVHFTLRARKTAEKKKMLVWPGPWHITYHGIAKRPYTLIIILFDTVIYCYLIDPNRRY